MNRRLPRNQRLWTSELIGFLKIPSEVQMEPLPAGAPRLSTYFFMLRTRSGILLVVSTIAVHICCTAVHSFTIYVSW